LAHRYAHVGPRTFDVSLLRIRQRLDGRGVDLRVAGEKSVVGVHGAPLTLRSVGRGAVPGNFERSTLPCAGIIRTGTKGVISPPRHSIARGPLASLRTLLQSVGVSNSATFFGAGRHRVAGARLTGHQK